MLIISVFRHFVNKKEVKHLYRKFEELLKKRGLRPINVSVATGLNYSTLADWKSGRATPKGDKIYKIAKFFGVPMEYFYED